MVKRGAVADIELTLLGRRNCHLCEDMRRELSELPVRASLVIQYIDIDEDPELADKFNEIVPVLLHGQNELGRVRLDVELVLAYIEQLT